MELKDATGKSSKPKVPVRGRRIGGRSAGADSELIAWCREFAALEQRILIATVSVDCAVVRKKITSPLYNRQDKLLECIRGTTPRSLTGCQAIGSTLSLLTRFLGETGTNWDLLMALLSGLSKL